MADLLKIDVNVPVQVALTRKGPGRAVESKFGGEQRMYTLATATGDRVLYAPVELAEQIDKLSLSAGEPFVIQKRVATEGQRTVTRWLAERPGPSQPLRPRLLVRLGVQFRRLCARCRRPASLRRSLLASTRPHKACWPP
jgi:hypothetical protein